MEFRARARAALKGNWAPAIAVECISAAGMLLIIAAGLAAARLAAFDTDVSVPASSLWNGAWPAVLPTAGMLLFDWLLLSPLKLGRAAFYAELAGGAVRVSALFRFFGRRYGAALWWRLSLWLRRAVFTALLLIPATLALGFSRALRLAAAETPERDAAALLCLLAGWLLVPVALGVCELLMARYQPAAFWLAAGGDNARLWGLFRRAARAMRGRVLGAAGLELGFFGYFAACLLLLPAFYVRPLHQTARAVLWARPAPKKAARAPADTISLPSLTKLPPAVP